MGVRVPFFFSSGSRAEFEETGPSFFSHVALVALDERRRRRRDARDDAARTQHTHALATGGGGGGGRAHNYHYHYSRAG